MSKLFKRFRTDKKFRKNVIIGVIIFIFLTNMGEPETQATWNVLEADECKGGLFSSPDKCVAAGCVWSGDRFTDLCTNCIPNSERISTHYVYDSYSYRWPEQICCSGLFKHVEDANLFIPGNQKGIICKAPDDPDVTDVGKCRKWMKPFHDIWKSIFKDSDMSCPSAAYVIIAFGAVAILAVL